MIFAGMKRLANQMETTRYRPKWAIIKNLTGKYHIQSLLYSNDGSVWVSVQRPQKLNLKMRLQTKTQTGDQECQFQLNLYGNSDQAPQGRRIKNIRKCSLVQAHQENLFWYSTAPSECIQKCRSLQQTTVPIRQLYQFTSMWIMSMVYMLKALTLVKQPFHPRAVDQTA